MSSASAMSVSSWPFKLSVRFHGIGRDELAWQE